MQAKSQLVFNKLALHSRTKNITLIEVIDAESSHNFPT
jgi:hypothetical protein